jgi:hypothetical protein
MGNMDDRAFGQFGTLGFICRSKSIRTVPLLLMLSNRLDYIEAATHRDSKTSPDVSWSFCGCITSSAGSNDMSREVQTCAAGEDPPNVLAAGSSSFTSFESSSFSRHGRNTWILASSLVVVIPCNCCPPEVLLYLNAPIPPHPCHLLPHGLGPDLT